ncbi:MAG: tetratricopeptide repeat protein [Nitrospinaceae bacterium]
MIFFKTRSLAFLLSCLLILTSALAAHAETAEEILAKANSLDKDGFWEESVLEWEKLLKSNPENKLRTLARLKLVKTYFKLGQFEQSVQTAKESAAENPESFHAFFHLANALARTGNFPEAVEAFQKIVQLRPDEGLALVGLALSHFGNRDSQKAIERLKESKVIFKKKKNIPWYQNARIMIPQIKDFARFPANFSDLWLENNLKLVRETYEQALFDPENL